MRTVLPCVAVFAAALAVGLAVSAGDAPGAGHGILGQQPEPAILAEIHAYRAETWRWQGLMGVERTPYYDRPENDPSVEYAQWVRDLWRTRAFRARRLALKPPHLLQFLCIHRFEGSWTAQTGNGYFGGLQMDLVFQQQYGHDLLGQKGTANHWTPLEQIWVAERAHRSGRGFYPWPNTARFCGLI